MPNIDSPEPRHNRAQLYLLWSFRIALVLAIGMVTWLGLTEVPPSIGLEWDKLNHVAAFSVLAGLAWFSHLVPNKPRYSGFLVIFVYGIALECLQTTTTNRVFEWSDIAADTLGIAIYAIALHPIAVRLPILNILAIDNNTSAAKENESDHESP
ncbi:MAG: VanZ family protein [Pseudomonadota bacterium]